MSLAAEQHLLARLYTDAELRRRFFAEPQAVGQAEGLDPDAARGLASPRVREQVETFARALVAKRLQSVRPLLPGTARLLGPKFAELFRVHAEKFAPQGRRKIPQDALTFALKLRESEVFRQLPRHAAAVLAWEEAAIRAGDPEFRVALHFFRYGMPALLKALDDGHLGEPRRRLCWALWIRGGAESEARCFRLVL